MNDKYSWKPRFPKPFRLLFAILATVIAINAIVISVCPLSLISGRMIAGNLVGALCLALAVTPFIWLIIVRYLWKAILGEATRTKAVLGFIVDAVIILDSKGNVESLNPAAEKIFGYLPGEIVGRNIRSILPEINVGNAGESERFFLSCCETAGLRRNGEQVAVQVSISKLVIASLTSFTLIIHDISERKRVSALIKEQKEFVTNLVENSAVPTFVIDSEHRVLIWNRACTELTGVQGEEMLGKDEPWRAFYPVRRPVLADLVVDGSTDNDHLFYSSVKKSKFIPEGLQAEGWYKNLNGHDRYISFSAAPIRNRNGDLVAVIETFEDITDLKEYEEQLEYHASHDMLTRLPNRNLLTDRVHQALLLSRRNQYQVVVFMIDLDNFKLVNESLGHDTGNMLLKKVAERLNRCLRAEDTVARQGGDEFIVVISGPDVADHAAQKAAEIQDVISRPFQIDQNELILTCTMGISIFPKDSSDVDTLLNNAGSALYRAKEQGRGVFQFYTDQMNVGAVTRIVMQQNLRRALEGNGLSLHYQPKVNLSTGLIAGLEALARWHDPELGEIPPSIFIPLAEETGLIEHVGEWVLRTACAQNKSWQDAGLPPTVVAVNLSARQFRQKDLAGMIGQILAETGLESRYLELEITESVVMHNVERVSAILDELKRMGVYLTMDDFGTGYSSLSSLKQFPFDKIKIDQSFVQDIISDPHSAAIARTIIVMAHSLHLEVIAEGVETEGQLNYLKQQQCDVMQGFYFSEPVPAYVMETMLRENFRKKSEIDAASISEKTILIVDDDEDVLDALGGMLTMEGYRVLLAASADAGFEMLAGNRVSVVISDQRMPVMTGSEFLGRVKELYPDTVRILLTGHADMESIMEAINNGAIFKILQKPLHADFIRGKVEEAFKFHEMISWKRQSGQKTVF